MLTEKLYEVLKHEGVVSIVSWGVDEAHVTCQGVRGLGERERERKSMRKGIKKPGENERGIILLLVDDGLYFHDDGVYLVKTQQCLKMQ